MVVGILTCDLHLNGCSSLKEKRRVLKSLKDRLHARLNVSVAETNHQDKWQRAELTCGVVATERRHAQSVLTSVERLVATNGLARILDSSVHFL